MRDARTAALTSYEFALDTKARRLLRTAVMMFLNRVDAGRQLAVVLYGRHTVMPIVVGLTYGGVPVAAEIAHALHAPFDICVVRPLMIQQEPLDVRIGAIAEGGATYLDPDMIGRYALSPDELKTVLAREALEVLRVSRLLREQPPIDVRGCDVILVDDGVISVGPMRAAAREYRRRGAHALELATPVAASEVLYVLRHDFDHITCLEAEPLLTAVGARYSEHWPVSDAEVLDTVAAELRGAA